MVTTGTLAAYAFKAVFGNPDVMTGLATWTIFLTLLFLTIAIYKETRRE